ncbi:MAG TPA: undecaprenyl-diphosphate phosphatase [Spirochaetia bacterium]|nr:undecaprenyl-diphosphate phosphatase [Spirochaetia bacterium]
MHILALIKAAILGVVEGVTEFLPVSSTGHLIIAETFIKMSNDAKFVAGFEVIIQLGAMLAIVVLFWKTIWPWAAPAEERTRTWQLWLRIIIGVIPAAILGYALDKFITEKLFNPIVVSITLIFYGIVLIVIENVFKKNTRERHTDVHTISLGVAFAIGLFQTLAMIPGTSRSAATIIGGMIMGLGRAAAAEFSFFLAVPVMVGATGLTVAKQGLHFTASEWVLLAVGFIVSFLVALVVVRAFMNYLRKRDFIPFGYYRIVLGILVLVVLVVLKV